MKFQCFKRFFFKKRLEKFYLEVNLEITFNCLLTRQIQLYRGFRNKSSVVVKIRNCSNKKHTFLIRDCEISKKSWACFTR